MSKQKTAQTTKNNPVPLQAPQSKGQAIRPPTLGIEMVDTQIVQRMPARQQSPSSVATENKTGLPDNLKAGIETLSGYAMDEVKVHYNSSKPAQLNAHAYAQGVDIYLGSGQEKHLPHEAWHVVQQKQGRVKPTRQLKGNMKINDETALEKEATVMGQQVFSISPKAAQKSKVAARKFMQSNVIQGNGIEIQKLRIGIIGPNQVTDMYANELPENTNVWILSNKPVDANALDNANPKVTPGHNKSTPLEIIRANENNVKNHKKNDEARSLGRVKSRLFQSGEFQVPRQNQPADRNEVDYSFLRYAAFESYKLWHASTGNALGWPSLTANTTLVESIDSDRGGISGLTNMVETDAQGIKNDWLAEAGVYSWDWHDVKGSPKISGKFKNADDSIDTTKRDKALEEFSNKYNAAEIQARQTAKSSDIFKIYFPEPATRLSPSALKLLENSDFGKIKITRGQQVGRKRESIGLIAGLVFLDKQVNNVSTDRAKSKLKFNPSYLVTTGLGNRQDAYISVFSEWYANAAKLDGGFNDVPFSSLNSAKNFDQSYLNPNVPVHVLQWHINTLEAMEQDKANAGEFFLNPKSN